MKKSKRLLLRIMAMLMCFTMALTSAPSLVTQAADSFNYSAGFGGQRDGDSRQWQIPGPPPKNDVPAQNDYPWTRFSDFGLKYPSNTGTGNVVSTDQEDVTIVEEIDPSDRTDTGDPDGTTVAIPALYVGIVEIPLPATTGTTYNSTYIQQQVAAKLANTNSATILANSLKFISLDSIKKSGSSYAINETRLREEVKRTGNDSFILEDWVADHPHSGNSEVTLASNIIRSFMQGKKNGAADDPTYHTSVSTKNYAVLVKALREYYDGYNNTNVFTEDVMNDVLNIAQAGNVTGKSTIPVVVFYNGFFAYANEHAGVLSQFRTYAQTFGVDFDDTGFSDEWEDLEDRDKWAGLTGDTDKPFNKMVKKFASMDQAVSNSYMGTATEIAFDMENEIFTSDIYLNEANITNYSATGSKYSLSKLNSVTVNNRKYFGRSFLVYQEGVKENIGGSFTLHYKVDSISGREKKYDDGWWIVPGGQVKNNYSDAIGYYTINLSEVGNVAQTANRSEGWEIKLQMTPKIASVWNGKLIKSSQQKNVTNMDYCWFRFVDPIEHQYWTPPTLADKSNSGGSYTATFKLSQAELRSLVQGGTVIEFWCRPSSGSGDTVYNAMEFKMWVKDPFNGNTFKVVAPTEHNAASKFDSTGYRYYTYKDSAGDPVSASFLYWHAGSATSTIGLDSVENNTFEEQTISSLTNESEVQVTEDEESDGVVDMSSDGIVDMSSEEDGVVDMSASSTVSITNDTSENEIATIANNEIAPISVTGSFAGQIPWSEITYPRVAYAEVMADDYGYVGQEMIDKAAKKVAGSYNVGWTQDWNVLTGIPSTETLTVSAGGSQYGISASGFINTENNIVRTVRINADVTNGWGSGYQSYPCNLSNHGQKPCSRNAGTIDPGCADHGGSPVTCSHCQQTFSPAGHIIEYDETGKKTRDEHGKNPHNCDTYYAFNCSTGQPWLSGMSHISTSATPHDSQGYNGQTTARCNVSACQATYTDTCNKGLIDDGYTHGAGNHCEGRVNLYHYQSDHVSLSIDELIDTASWREITSTRILALGYTDLNDINDKLIDASLYDGYAASNTNIFTFVWRGALGLVDGANNKDEGFKRAGHLWYTQLPEPEFKQGGGWNSSSINYMYFLGDMNVDMHMYCDSRWAEAATNGAATSESISQGRSVTFPGNQINYGQTARHYVTPAEAGGGLNGGIPPETWRGSRLPFGDTTGTGQLQYIVIDAFNAWQSHNMNQYKANVISDFMVTGIMQGNWADNHWQNNYADIHSVDTDEGLSWFGFENPLDWNARSGRKTINITQDIYRRHRCKGDQAGALISGAYSDSAVNEPLIAGYIGTHVLRRDGLKQETYCDVKGTYGHDFIPWNWTFASYFLDDRLTGLSGNERAPSSGGEPKLACGDPIMPNKADAPYGRWLWPDEKLLYTHNYDLDANNSNWSVDLSPGYSDSALVGGGANHKTSSGYTMTHLITNGRRAQDDFRGNNPREFEGYYRKHSYGFVGGNMYLVSYVNKMQFDYFRRNSEYKDTYYYQIVHNDINNNGSTQSLYEFDSHYFPNVTPTWYRNTLVLSDIDIRNTAPNGLYRNAFTAINHFVPILFIDTPSVMNGASNRCEDFGGYVTKNVTVKGVTVAVQEYQIPCNFTDAQTGINDIVIHDPISVEYSHIMGHKYKDYYTNAKKLSLSEDQRVYQNPDGTWREIDDSDPAKNDYLVVGDEFHVWVSDYGDFYEPSTERSSNPWKITAASKSRAFVTYVDRQKVSDLNTGQRIAGSDATYKDLRGFQDQMNTGTWIWERLISFNFPITYTNRSGQEIAVGSDTLINLDDVGAVYSGGYGYTQKRTIAGQRVNDTDSTVGQALWHSNPKNAAGQGINGALVGEEAEHPYAYGLEYAFKVLPSAYETRNGEVTVYARAINATSNTVQKGANNESNLIRDNNYAAKDYVSKTMNIEIVGLIGNIALTDVGDFRYSNLFKRAIQDEWLIPGVVHKVDPADPREILSVKNDIFGANTTGGIGKETHSSMSITHFTKGSSLYGGKAAIYEGAAPTTGTNQPITVWNYLPLTAAYNNIKEYRDEQVKLGYNAYFDIETIGNYYGFNYNAATTVDGERSVNRGPLTASDPDTRKNVMTITPYYFLYDPKGTDGSSDPSKNKWTPVGLWMGSAGNRTMFYNDGVSKQGQESSNLYINLSPDLDNERDRRIVDPAEQVLTRLVQGKNVARFGQQAGYSALTERDFIGTSTKIVLDQFDRNFVGSNTLYGAIVLKTDDSLGDRNGTSAEFQSRIGGMFANLHDFTGVTVYIDGEGEADGLQDIRFAQQSQRWFFTLGLPSSTYVTYPLDWDSNQLEVEDSHDRMMKDHPDGVIVGFLDIKVTGDVWTLQYDNTVANQGENNKKRRLYPNYPGDPDNNDDTIDFDKLIPKIDPKWVPVVVFDKEKSSTLDWSTAGTH